MGFFRWVSGFAHNVNFPKIQRQSRNSRTVFRLVLSLRSSLSMINLPPTIQLFCSFAGGIKWAILSISHCSVFYNVSIFVFGDIIKYVYFCIPHAFFCGRPLEVARRERSASHALVDATQEISHEAKGARRLRLFRVFLLRSVCRRWRLAKSLIEKGRGQENWGEKSNAPNTTAHPRAQIR